MKKVEKNCLWCGKAFLTYPCEIKKGGGKFCSRSCASTYRNTYNNPAKLAEVREKISKHHADVSGEKNPMYMRRGAEAFYHYGGGKSKDLAENILSEIVKVGQNSRGAKVRKNSQGKDYYGFIRETSCPAVIVECAFVDNATDLKILASESDRQKAGRAIAKGILKTLGVEIQSERLYRVQVGAYLLRSNAEDMQKKIKAVGFDAFIVKE